MDTYLESAEFYQRRYQSYATKVIVPTSLFLLLAILCSLFIKKEISLSSGASLEPVKVLETLQSTSNHPIVSNHLSENKKVKAGQVLVVYEADTENIKQDHLVSQLERISNQQSALEQLKVSLETGKNHFSEPDTYGYYQQFQEYSNQAATLLGNINQQNSSIASQNAASLNQQAEVGRLIAETQAKMADYQAVRQAVASDMAVAETNVHYSLYQAYQFQVEQASTEADKGQLKNQTLVQIDGQIAQLETSLASYRVQYAGSGTKQAYTATLDNQVASLKAQYLTRLGQEASSLTQQKLELETNLKLQEGEVAKQNLIANYSGIVHINPEVEGESMVALGQELAHIYPDLEEILEVKVVTYLSSKDIARVKKGDKLRFQYRDKNDQNQQLPGVISSIASKASQTEHGGFFKVECLTKLTPELAKTLKYGLEGKAVMVTGRKTYFDYYKDLVLK